MRRFDGTLSLPTPVLSGSGSAGHGHVSRLSTACERSPGDGIAIAQSKAERHPLMTLDRGKAFPLYMAHEAS